jgi:hypothetical protein
MKKGVSMQRKRTTRDLYDLPRSALVSHLYRAREVTSAPNLPPVSLFSPDALWEWIRRYLAYVVRPKHFFPPYTASPVSAVYPLSSKNGSEVVNICIAGDWATGTEEAQRVADNMMESSDPDFTIHIGDVYYVGDPPEVNENCLGVRNPRNNYDPVTWPIGKNGSFALNGNHEMYANGVAYFEMLLPRLGLRTDECGTTGQQTSFFCLENEHWRMIAIDTGYNSTGVPMLSQVPYLNRISWIGGDCSLRKELLEWLTNVVRPERDRRGLVLLSHHQYYSAFDRDYRRPAQQLWEAGIQRPVLWFWGHEHRLAGYPLFGIDDLKAFGRCVGHGGMPIELTKPKKRQPVPTFFDERKSPNGFGVNGYVSFSFSGPSLTVEYFDLTGQRILSEQWKVGMDGGVEFVSKQKLITDPDFHA